MTGKTVAIFGSSRTEPDTSEWSEAERAGRLCAELGLAIVTGGYGGTMEAASKGAAGAGGLVVGVTASQMFQGRAGANPYVERQIDSESLTERIGHLVEIADAAIVLAGSIGTAAELLVAANLNQIARIHGTSPLPTVAVGAVWADMWELLVSRTSAHRSDLHLEPNVDAAVDWVASVLVGSDAG